MVSHSIRRSRGRYKRPEIHAGFKRRSTVFPAQNENCDVDFLAGLLALVIAPCSRTLHNDGGVAAAVAPKLHANQTQGYQTSNSSQLLVDCVSVVSFLVEKQLFFSPQFKTSTKTVPPRSAHLIFFGQILPYCHWCPQTKQPSWPSILPLTVAEAPLLPRREMPPRQDTPSTSASSSSSSRRPWPSPSASASPSARPRPPSSPPSGP